MLIIDLETILC